MTKIVKLTENDLVDIIKKVISEQTPNRRRFIKYDNYEFDSTDAKTNYSTTFKKLESENRANTENAEFITLEKNVQKMFTYETQNGYVKNLLTGDDQIALWDKMMGDKTVKYFVADIIKRVIYKSRPRFKSCRLGEGTYYDVQPTPEIVTPPSDVCVPSDLYTITIPTEVSQTDFFQNNSAQLKNTGVNEFYKTFVDPYVQLMSKFKQDKVTDYEICIASMDIKSSSSRFKNTGPASSLSWKDLSQKRAENVRDYLTDEYYNKGIAWCPTDKFFHREATIDANGQNGDGSSGPNPPEGYTFLPKGSSYSTTNFKIGGNFESLRKEYGEPLPADTGGNKVYEKFKYVLPEVKIKVNYTSPQPDKKDPKKGENTAPDLVIAPKQKYWANLYTWSFGFGKGDGSGSRKKYETQNVHNSAKKQEWDDFSEIDVKKGNRKIYWFTGKSAKKWKRKN